VKGLILAQSER